MAHKYGSEMSDDMKDYSHHSSVGSNGNCSDLNKPRRPLIENVTNNWQNEKVAFLEQESGFRLCDLDDDSSCPKLIRKASPSRRARRTLLLVLLLLGLALWTWIWYLRPQLEGGWEIEEGFMAQENGTYGIAKGAHFNGVRMEILDAGLVPGGVNDPDGKRRLVFVGDIHGCAHELKKLLKKVDFDERMDHLIAVGDTISKGPKNVKVLDKLIKLGASSVRGNHEDRILALAPSILELPFTQSSDETLSNGAAKDAKLLRELSKHHLKYLKSMPLMLRIPALPMADKPSRKTKSPLAEDLLVVHAGLVPAVTLEKQDPFFVMNMRAIKTKSHLPTVEAAAKKTKSKPWHHIWGWYNDRLFRKKSLKGFEIWDDLAWDEGWDEERDSSWLGLLGLKSRKKWPKPQVVVYGHHAKAGLQIDRWSKGLDTGCVRGGKLTAMVLDARGIQKFVSVGCKDYR